MRVHPTQQIHIHTHALTPIHPHTSTHYTHMHTSRLPGSTAPGVVDTPSDGVEGVCDGVEGACDDVEGSWDGVGEPGSGGDFFAALFDFEVVIFGATGATGTLLRVPVAPVVEGVCDGVEGACDGVEGSWDGVGEPGSGGDFFAALFDFEVVIFGATGATGTPLRVRISSRRPSSSICFVPHAVAWRERGNVTHLYRMQ